MPYDLFISYSRRDDINGYINALIERIKSDFAIFSGRPLTTFFDKNEIHGMEEWRLRILQGLRESRLLLACLSPSYLNSEYCEWEFNEYLKHEIGRAFFGDGIATIYFVEIPGWDDKDFDKKCAVWVNELRRRQHFDFRPWFHEGEVNLREAMIKERMKQLSEQLKLRITKSERAEHNIGNIDANNPHFIGRLAQMRRLRQQFVEPGTIGVITAVNGLGGIGKTALAIQYAHTFADEYGGGCWQVRCEGKEDLMEAIARLSEPLRLNFNVEETKSIERQYHRVIAELHSLSNRFEPHNCLLLLDNVDKPKLLEPAQTKNLPAEEWLHILVTTRLGESDLFGTSKDRVFIPIDELSHNEALDLIQDYQPGGKFSSTKEREAADEIIRILDRFTLAVEITAVYLGKYSGEINCSDFLIRLKAEGFSGLEYIAQTEKGLQYGEKSLTATLTPTLERLSEPEQLTLKYTSLLPSDQIALPWIRILLSEKFSEFGEDSEPGYPDPWKNLIRHLLGLRLLYCTNLLIGTDQLTILKMHRMVQHIILEILSKDIVSFIEVLHKSSGLIYKRSVDLCSSPFKKNFIWELNCLFITLKIWLVNNRYHAQSASVHCCSALREYGQYINALELSELLIETINKNGSEPNVSVIWCHNMAGIAALYMENTNLSELHFMTASRLSENPETDDLDRLDTLTNIGCFYRETLRPMMALEPSKEALEISQNRFGKESPEAGIRCINLGLVFQDLCNLKEAIPLLQLAVKIDLEHPDLKLRTSQDLGTYAEALRNAGTLLEAELHARKALKIIHDHEYEQHPSTVNVKINLAAILEEQNNIKEARNLIESARDLAIACFGETSPVLSLCLNNLGINSLLGGNLIVALDELQNSLRIELSQKNKNFQKLAHRELNIGVIFLLANEPIISLSHLHTGWEYKIKTGQPDLLTARLLLVRLIISFVFQENYELFTRQLNKILDLGHLTASEINIRWSLERVLKDFINRFPTDQIALWNRYYKLILSMEDQNNIMIIKPDLAGKENGYLNERWPDHNSDS